MKFLIRSIIYVSILFFLCFNIPGFTAEDSVMALDSEDYFPQVHKSLQEAKESIYIVMHIMEIGSGKENDPTEQLVQDLIDAHQRGVKVKVILDRNLPEVEEELTEFEKVRNKNDKSYVLLKNEGLDVSFDPPGVVTMSSLIIIDNHISILGSAFWCYASLVENIESSVAIRSKRIAKGNLERILKIESLSKNYPEKAGVDKE